MGGLSHANIERDIYLFSMVDANRNKCKMLFVAIWIFYGKNIKAVKVPHIEQLSIKYLLNWGIESTDIKPQLLQFYLNANNNYIKDPNPIKEFYFNC